MRDKADTISWLAKTEEKLGGFSTTVNMLENALTVVKDMTVNYPNDASLFYMSANIHMQQSYLLSYLADKRIAYQKALFANKMISNALKQDSKDNKLQLMYYRSLAQLLMLSNDKNIDPRIEEIITFLKSQSLNNIRVISIKIGLIQYFIDRNLLHKAQKLLTTLESHESYQQLIAKQAKIGDNLVLIRINLLKAKLAATSTQKDQFCLSALQRNC